MIWNLLGLQRKLDALFDDGWIRLGIGSGDASHLHAVRDGVEEMSLDEAFYKLVPAHPLQTRFAVEQPI